METDSLYSKTDGNGKGSTVQILYTSLSGPDLLPIANQNIMQYNIVPFVKVTKTTHQALDYYSRINICKTSI